MSKASMQKIIAIASVFLGFTSLIMIKAADSVPSLAQNKPNSEVTGDARTINPIAIHIFRKTLANLDKTINTGQDFDYWPDGGIQIAYYHLATFISYQSLCQLSPEPVFLSGPHSKINLHLSSGQTFGYYNPKFLQWFQNHLSATLQNKRFVKSTQINFQTYLGKTVQTYWATYTVLNQHPQELNALLKDYEQRLNERSLPEAYYYNIAWQENSDQYDSLRELSTAYDMNVVAPAVYFWLRRRLDGTDQQVFAMVEYLMDTYHIK